MFICTSYAFVPKELRKKLDARFVKTFFVGYNATSKEYWFWHLIKNHITICRNVLFCENEILIVAPCKEDPGEYFTNDLSIQGRGREVWIHQDEAAREVAEPQNEDEGTVQQNEDAQNGDVKTIQKNVDEMEQDARSIQQDEEIQQNGEEGHGVEKMVQLAEKLLLQH